ncbi:fatty acid cis/trans isomerase [Vibrio chagasii]|nr:fatty acid cis/trans isomerase [Vibrio chagasii]
MDVDQRCPTIERVRSNMREITLRGVCLMGCLADKTEYATLMSWLENGALMNEHIPLSEAEQRAWLILTKSSSTKVQIAFSVIYEHLFLSPFIR